MKPLLEYEDLCRKAKVSISVNAPITEVPNPGTENWSECPKREYLRVVRRFCLIQTPCRSN